MKLFLLFPMKFQSIIIRAASFPLSEMRRARLTDTDFRRYIFRFIYISTLCLLIVNAQPLSCKEDAHCSEGYFCETQANVCQECLRCQDLQRQPPKQDVSNECIKTIDICGTCAVGYINIYGDGIKGKCVLPEFFEFGIGPHYIYVCMTGAVVGLLIVAAFMYVIKQSDVFRVVAYYEPVSENLLATDIIEPDMKCTPILQHLLHFNKPDSKLQIIIATHQRDSE